MMSENGLAKVHRATELLTEISKINKQIHALEKQREPLSKEYSEIMADPYIYDKVNGLRMGGIL